MFANLKTVIAFGLIWTFFCGLTLTSGNALAQNMPGKQIRKDQLITGSQPDKNTRSTEKYSSVKYKQPIRFEPNKGQTDPKVKYLAHGLGYGLFLTSEEAVMVFNKAGAIDRNNPERSVLSKKTAPSQSSTLRMKFVDANPKPKIAPTGILAGTQNYLSGKQNVLNLPGYGKVNYNDLYDGVNLTFYSNQQSLEYDFIIAPNADVSAIRLKFTGAESINIASNGDLVLKVGGEEVRHLKPNIYQETAGVKKEVEGEYAINDKGEVGFRIGQYDKSKSLIIDPILSFSTFLGGDRNDGCAGLFIDSDGNLYVTGGTSSTNFPGTTTSPPPTVPFHYRVFITKFDAGGQLLFSTYWGDDDTLGSDIKVDGSGIYVAGMTSAISYPTTPGAFQTIHHPNPPGDHVYDLFITKLNLAGTSITYSTFLGGTDEDEAPSIAVDTSGNVFITGTTQSTNFPTTPGALSTSITDNSAAFVTKLNSTGSALIYSTYLGGDLPQIPFISSADSGNDIFLDAQGNAIVAGSTDATNFPTTSGAYQTGFAGGGDGFVSKLNSNGTGLIYSTFIGGSNTDAVTDFDVDSNGDIYVTGFTASSNFPVTSGVVQSTFGGGIRDSFITKFNSSASALTYSTYLGGSSRDDGNSIKIDAAGNAFVLGTAESANFPTTADAFQTSLKGAADVSLTKLNSTGSTLLYSTYFGGDQSEMPSVLEISKCGDVHFAGLITNGTGVNNFPVRQAFQSTDHTVVSGFQNIEGFITKFSFLNSAGTAPEAIGNGSLPVMVSEYKLPSYVDTEVLDVDYQGQPVQIELWASVHRPATLNSGTQYPILVFLHGMHSTCERNSTPNPTDPFAPRLGIVTNWYSISGSCDDPNTLFDEAPYYNVIPNHRGYDYLAENLASWGYIVVSINANRGIHMFDKWVPAGYGYPTLVRNRGWLVLRHLQKLREWNDCTTNPGCQTPSSLGIDLRGKLDFSNIGLMGHSRGGQGVRAAYNLYKSGPAWQARIPGANFKAVFEIGPTDYITQTQVVYDPVDKFIVDGAKWNVLLPMCDADIKDLSGMNVYDRMLLLKTDNPATQKSTFTVWGANHNFYNTAWTFSEFGAQCYFNDPLFSPTQSGSEKQRLTASASVVPFFRANVGSSANANLNQNFNPLYESPVSIQNTTRVERNYIPSPNTSLTTVFEDFVTNNANSCSSGSNTCTVSGSNVSHAITQMMPYHDESLKALLMNWSAPGSDKFLQINWKPSGQGTDVSNHQTFDFRISRNSVGTNVRGATNFTIQLVMANDSLSNGVKLCNYAYVDGPVGGYAPNASTGTYREVLQTVRIPLTAFTGANLSQIRGVKITFDESPVGSIHLANLRFTK
jgi:hypothetical protein